MIAADRSYLLREKRERCSNSVSLCSSVTFDITHDSFQRQVRKGDLDMIIVQEKYARKNPHPCQRLVEYFMIAGVNAHSTNEMSTPIDSDTSLKILYRYPVRNYGDCDLPEYSHMFCFPDGASPQEEPQPATCTFFVLTDLDGKRLYACAIRYFEQMEQTRLFCPRAICFFSRHRVLNLLKDLCLTSYQICRTEQRLPNFPLETLVYTIVGRASYDLLTTGYRFDTPKVAFTINPNSKSVVDQISWWALFKCLDMENILQVMSALLTEQRVIVCSAQSGLVTMVMETLLVLLQPFEWQHTYIPCLPNELVDYIHAPGTYFIGMSEKMLQYQTLEAILEMGVVVALLDENIVYSSTNKRLSSKCGDKLKDIISPLISGCGLRYDALTYRGIEQVDMKDILPPEIFNTIRKAFFNTFQEYLSNYRDFLIEIAAAPQSVVIFHELGFMQHYKDEEFWSAFVESQMFASFLELDMFSNREHSVLQGSFERIIMNESDQLGSIKDFQAITYSSEMGYSYRLVNFLDDMCVAIQSLELENWNNSDDQEQDRLDDPRDEEQSSKIETLQEFVARTFNDKQFPVERYHYLREIFAEGEMSTHFLRFFLHAAQATDQEIVLKPGPLYQLIDCLNVILDLVDEDILPKANELLRDVLILSLTYKTDDVTSIFPFMVFLRCHTCWEDVQFWIWLYINCDEDSMDRMDSISAWKRHRSSTVIENKPSDSPQENFSKNIQFIMFRLGISKDLIGQFLSLTSLKVSLNSSFSGSVMLLEDVVSSQMDIPELLENLKTKAEIFERYNMTPEDGLIAEYHGSISEAQKQGVPAQLCIWHHCVTFTTSKFGIKKKEMVNYKNINMVSILGVDSIEITSGRRVLLFQLKDAVDAFYWIRRYWITTRTGHLKRRKANVRVQHVSSEGMLKVDDLETLMNHASYTTYGSGFVILSPETPFRGLYYLASGQLKIEGSNMNQIDVLDSGGLFGEFNFILGTGAPWSYTTIDSATIFEISSEAIYRLSMEDPGLGGRLHAHVASNLVRLFRYTGQVSIPTTLNQTTSSASAGAQNLLRITGGQTKLSASSKGSVYPCTYSKVVQVVGNMTTSAEAIVFSARVLGVTLTESIIVKNITSMSTSGDALIIELPDRSYSFSDFEDASAVFSDIQKKWDKAKSKTGTDTLRIRTRSRRFSGSLKTPSTLEPNKLPMEKLEESSYETQESSLKIAPMSPEDYTLFIQGAKLVTYKRDAYIIKEGDDDQVVYQVAKGRVRVETGGFRDQPISIVRHLGENDMFGEMTFITGGKRLASVRADEDLVQCYRLEASFLESLLESTQSGLPLRFYRSLASYLAHRLMDRLAKGH